MEIEVKKIKVLGRGSYGVVHLVENKTRGSRLYAAKSADLALSSSLAKERDILHDFIGCPNVVQSFGAYERVEPNRGKVYYLFLEYASGGSLLDLMKNKYGGKIPECDVKEYVRMILKGLVEIHVRGYVHSDLKPGNILVFPSDQDGASGLSTLKIADFGLAKHFREDDDPRLLRKYGFRGSPVYMSPESVLGQVSRALDVWSLGCIIVQMITGKLPWDYRDLEDLKAKLLTAKSPKIPKNMSGLGKDFLTKCFDRDPELRWTAEMLLSHPFLLPTEDISSFSFATSSACLPFLKIQRIPFFNKFGRRNLSASRGEVEGRTMKSRV